MDCMRNHSVRFFFCSDMYLIIIYILAVTRRRASPEILSFYIIKISSNIKLNILELFLNSINIYYCIIL